MKTTQRRTRRKSSEIKNPQVLYTRVNGSVLKRINNIAKERGVCRTKLLADVLSAFIKQA